jgi:hypothetical protein
MLHLSWCTRWNENCRLHRFHPYNAQADTQLLDFGGERAVELPVEIGLAVELWRVRGCPQEGLVADMKLAKEIVQAGAWSA